MSEPVRPFPGPLQAVLLTLLGVFLSALVAVVASQHLTPTAALGLATVVGLGAAALLGATNVPRPHAERVGLIGLRGRHLAPLLLLLPIALLASEVDNVVQQLFPLPDAQEVVERTTERIPTDTRVHVSESLIVAVGLVPLIEEWLFRGVIQQGVIGRLGPRLGIVFTSLLFAIGHGGPGVSLQAWGAMVSQTLVLGLALGYARHATGSLLAPIALHAGINLAGVLALAYAEQLPIAGFNAPGPHTSPWLLLPAALAVGAGIALLARDEPPPIPDPPPLEEETDDEGFSL